MSEPPLLVLDSARLTVDPGEEVLLSLRVRNRSAVVDELKIEVLGASAEWAEVEPPVLSLFPGADGEALVRFRPPRTSKLAAGALPVGVRVVSTVDAGRKAVEECQLQIGSFRDVTAELWPKSSRGLRKGRHELRLRNAGNVPAGVSVEPADLDGSCRVTVQPSRVVVAPGQVSSARVAVRPSRMLWFGSVETYSFAVRAEPEPGKELKVPGSMRQGPLVPGSAATLALAAVAAVAAVVFLLAGHGPALMRAVAVVVRGVVVVPVALSVPVAVGARVRALRLAGPRRVEPLAHDRRRGGHAHAHAGTTDTGAAADRPQRGGRVHLGSGGGDPGGGPGSCRQPAERSRLQLHQPGHPAEPRRRHRRPARLHREHLDRRPYRSVPLITPSTLSKLPAAYHLS